MNCSAHGKDNLRQYKGTLERPKENLTLIINIYRVFWNTSIGDIQQTRSQKFILLISNLELLLRMQNRGIIRRQSKNGR